MKVKDYLRINKLEKLEGLKVRTPNSVVGYIFSIGNCIVFLNNVSGNSTDKGRLFPQVVNSIEDVKEKWDIVADGIACNCDILTAHKYIMNNS